MTTEFITPLDMPVNVNKHLVLIGKQNKKMMAMRTQLVYHARSNGRFIYILDNEGDLFDWAKDTPETGGVIVGDGTLEHLVQFVAEVQETNAFGTIAISWTRIKKQKKLFNELLHLSNIGQLAGITIQLFTSSVSNMYLSIEGRALFLNMHQRLWAEQRKSEINWLKENLNLTNEQLENMKLNQGVLSN